MSSDRRSHRFDSRWRFSAVETNSEETFQTPDAAGFSPNRESTNDPAGRDFDEALEQIGLEGCRVCPLCGAIVARDGSVLG
jgi:hypothetical protein